MTAGLGASLAAERQRQLLSEASRARVAAEARRQRRNRQVLREMTSWRRPVSGAQSA
jgi:hypothetical protein